MVMSENEKNPSINQDDLEKYGVWLDDDGTDEVPTLHEVLEENPERSSLTEESYENPLDVAPTAEPFDIPEEVSAFELSDEGTDFNVLEEVSSRDNSKNILDISEEALSFNASDSNQGDDAAGSLTKHLQEELAALREEVDELKRMLTAISNNQQLPEHTDANDEQSGFFEYDVNDETIALNSNELDNIFKTSNIVESTGIASSAEEVANFFESTNIEESENDESIVVDDLDSLISNNTSDEALTQLADDFDDSDDKEDFPMTEDITTPEDVPLSDLTSTETTGAEGEDSSADLDAELGELPMDIESEDEFIPNTITPQAGTAMDTGVEAIPYPSFTDVDENTETEDFFESIESEPDSADSPAVDDSMDIGSMDLESLDIEIADEPESTPHVEEWLKKPLIDVISLLEELSKEDPDRFSNVITAEKKGSLEYLISLLKE